MQWGWGGRSAPGPCGTTQLAAAGPCGHCAVKVDREVVDDKVVVNKVYKYMAVLTVVFRKNIAKL